MIETTLLQRTYQADVHLDLHHAPRVRVPLTARTSMDLAPEKIHIVFKKEGETGDWEAWAWWLHGVSWSDGRYRPEYGRAQLSKEELNRWDGNGMTPEWVAEIVEDQRLELARIGA